MAHKISPVTFTQEPWHGIEGYREKAAKLHAESTKLQIQELLKS